MSEKRDPFQTPDDEARALAGKLREEGRFGALGTMHDGAPMVTRVALAPTPQGLLTLVSDLAPHTDGLRNTPEASLLIGEPGRGDPLAHPRITLQVRPEFQSKTATIVEAYLAKQPKAQLYIGFADFHIVRLCPTSAILNGGFGKAYLFGPDDL